MHNVHNWNIFFNISEWNSFKVVLNILIHQSLSKSCQFKYILEAFSYFINNNMSLIFKRHIDFNNLEKLGLGSWEGNCVCVCASYIYIQPYIYIKDEFNHSHPLYLSTPLPPVCVAQEGGITSSTILPLFLFLLHQLLTYCLLGFTLA